MLKPIQDHPVIAAILFVSALLGTFFTFETAFERLKRLVIGNDSEFSGKVCDSPPPDCGEDNADFLRFLNDAHGKVVVLDLRVIEGAPTAWRNRCDPDYTTWGGIRDYMSDEVTLLELPIRSEGCKAAGAVEIADKDLLPVVADGASHYVLTGRYLVATNSYGPVGWHILRKVN